jgi:hypothetical protein
VNITKQEGEKMGAGTRFFTVKILVIKWYKGVEDPTRAHTARHEKEVWAKQGRVIKAASRCHLQDRQLLPKSPRDSSPLRRRNGERVDVRVGVRG